MKGAELSWGLVIKVVLLIAVIGILLYFAYTYVLGHFVPESGLESRVVQLCPEWIKTGCREESADVLSIEVDGVPITLRELCIDFFNDNLNWYDKCKKKCFCP